MAKNAMVVGVAVLTAGLVVGCVHPRVWHDAQQIGAVPHSTLDPSKEVRMYAEREFSFELPGSVASITPYFGPVRESEWSPDWHPEFVHPAGGGQVPGAVFRTESEWGQAVWVLDRFESNAGRVGYVIFLQGIGVGRYDITVTQKNQSTVDVRVWGSRTAFAAHGARYVSQFEELFTSQGPKWEQAIAGILAQ